MQFIQPVLVADSVSELMDMTRSANAKDRARLVTTSLAMRLVKQVGLGSDALDGMLFVAMTKLLCNSEALRTRS